MLTFEGTLAVTSRSVVNVDYISTLEAPIASAFVYRTGSVAYEGVVEVPAEVYIEELDKTLPVTTVEIGAFINCPELEEVILPSSVTYIAMYAFADNPKLKSVNLASTIALSHGIFRGCSSLKSVEIPETVIAIHVAPFYNSGIESISLPESVISMEGQAFTGANSLKSIICPVPTPSDITVYANVIEGCYIEVPEGCVLYVPEESVEAYKAAALWSNFADILPIGSAAIEETEAVTDDADAPAYNLLGQPVANPRPGDFIIRNGKKQLFQ